MAAPATSAEAEESLARGQALQIGWHDVSYQYPDTSTPALDGVTETIPAGELAVIMGPSGCGKSTLGLTLNGVVPKTTGGRRRGEVTVGGRDPLNRELADIAADVGIVLQDPDAQLCTITVRDEISFGPQNLLVERSEILRRMRELAELVGLGGRLDDAVFELSGGQKQRVAIASVLAVRPRVLVLDEPTANLDPAGSREVLRLLTDVIGDQDMTILAIEHDPGDLLANADRLIVMDRGKIVASGPPRRLTAERGEEFAARGVRLPAATLFWLHTRSPNDDASAPLRVSDIDFDRLVGPPVSGAMPDAPPVAATSDDTVLRAEGIQFAYSGGRQVLTDLNLHIGRGEVVALMGPNGAGKSTFASLLVGLNRPTAGLLEVAGTDATRQPIRELARHVGYVFQYPEHQFVADRVIDEITISLERLSRDRSDIAARARECLERFDLEAHAERHPFRLSLGQKRRLSIAAMAVYRPDLLVLDEPTFGQDRAHTDQLVDAIADLNRDGSAVLLITHDLQLAAAVADRVAVVDEGHVVFDGHASVLLERLREQPRWGLWPIEEYELWHEVHRRRADVPFTVSPEALARHAQGAPA